MPINFSAEDLKTPKLIKRYFDSAGIQLTKREADRGNSTAQSNYSFYNLCGIGTAEDHNAGLGIKQDLKLAEEYAKKAAEQGDPEASIFVAIAYITGSHQIPINIEKAFHFLNIALQHAKKIGDVLDILNFELTQLPPQKQKAILIVIAQLANDRIFGQTQQQRTAHDIQVGKELLEFASEFGNALAMFLMGKLYEMGAPGTAQDFVLAKNYYGVASMSGSYDAQYELSRFFKEGLAGLPKDPNMSQRLLEAASLNPENSESSQKAKKQLTEKPLITAQFHQTFNQSYDHECPYGLWMPFDTTQEKDEIQRNASQGDPVAMNWLGHVIITNVLDPWYDSNCTTQLDQKKLAEGLHLIKCAAYLGNLSALYAYAQFLKRGHGENPNFNVAQLMLHSAGIRGHKIAAEGAIDLDKIIKFREQLEKENESSEEMLAHVRSMSFDALRLTYDDRQKSVKKAQKQNPFKKQDLFYAGGEDDDSSEDDSSDEEVLRKDELREKKTKEKVNREEYQPPNLFADDNSMSDENSTVSANANSSTNSSSNAKTTGMKAITDYFPKVSKTQVTQMEESKNVNEEAPREGLKAKNQNQDQTETQAMTDQNEKKADRNQMQTVASHSQTKRAPTGPGTAPANASLVKRSGSAFGKLKTRTIAGKVNLPVNFNQLTFQFRQTESEKQKAQNQSQNAQNQTQNAQNQIQKLNNSTASAMDCNSNLSTPVNGISPQVQAVESSPNSGPNSTDPSPNAVMSIVKRMCKSSTKS